MSIQPFVFPDTGQPVRTLEIDGEPWFVAVDPCSILGIGNPTQAVSYLDDDERATTLISSEGGQQRPTNIISEPGLYSLILRSRKPQAKAFKRWITHEVIPAIRKTGKYELGTLDDPLAEIERQTQLTVRAIEVARQERASRELAEQHAKELEPAARAWDVLGAADGDFSLREGALILNRDPAIQTGQNRLNDKLFELGMIDRKGIPYAKHQPHLRARPVSYQHPHTGEPRLSTQIRITVAGIKYLHQRMGGVAPLRFDITDAA